MKLNFSKQFAIKPTWCLDRHLDSKCQWKINVLLIVSTHRGICQHEYELFYVWNRKVYTLCTSSNL